MAIYDPFQQKTFKQGSGSVNHNGDAVKPAAPKATPKGLPEDFPGRDALLAAKIGTVQEAQALGANGLQNVKGIGEATAKEILAYGK